MGVVIAMETPLTMVAVVKKGQLVNNVFVYASRLLRRLQDQPFGLLSGLAASALCDRRL